MVRLACAIPWMVVSACSFPSPWEDAEPTEARIEGRLLATLDHPLPGVGWFRTGDLEAKDFGQASRQEVRGAREDVIVLQIGQVAPNGPTLFEIDVAMSAWVAGELPVDGIASIAQLRTPQGDAPFVVDGTIEVRQAGARPGERVEVVFADLVLGEVPP